MIFVPDSQLRAKITVANIPATQTIPIQALVQRDPEAEKILAANGGKASEDGGLCRAGFRSPERAYPGTGRVPDGE